ncbi:MAG: HNH endonuclease, partial [Acidobacteria bacterium]|nr:HNH endonuclease [Acidobacteriota bacterium]
MRVAGMDGSVLVLNRLFQAVHVTSPRRAFCLLYKGYVRVVDPDFRTYDFENWCDLPVQPDEDCIRTPKYLLRVPRVILLVDFDKLPRHEIRFTRRNIFFRDRNRCQYCGRKLPTRELNLDHVVPISRGGRSIWENVVCCCVDCNSLKANRVPAEAGMTMIRPPARPRWHP